MISRVKVDEEADKDFHYASVEKVFVPMMIFTACGMAFAHGSNDVANGVGPMAAVVGIVNSGGEVAQSSELPVWILLVGGIGIVVGLATYGYRVMRTIGTKITELTPTRGFCATMAAAMTVVLASRTGMPVSTTHIAVGGVIGVGMARGIGALDLRVIGGIVMSWVITLLSAACWQRCSTTPCAACSLARLQSLLFVPQGRQEKAQEQILKQLHGRHGLPWRPLA